MSGVEEHANGAVGLPSSRQYVAVRLKAGQYVYGVEEKRRKGVVDWCVKPSRRFS
jgi:hypothetical protein